MSTEIARGVALTAVRQLMAYAEQEAWDHRSRDALKHMEELVGREWTVKDGDDVVARIDMTDESLFFRRAGRKRWQSLYEVHDRFGTVPAGTRGRVIEIDGESPDDCDAYVIVDFQWTDDAGTEWSALPHLNHERWLRPASDNTEAAHAR